MRVFRAVGCLVMAILVFLGIALLTRSLKKEMRPAKPATNRGGNAIPGGMLMLLANPQLLDDISDGKIPMPTQLDQTFQEPAKESWLDSLFSFEGLSKNPKMIFGGMMKFRESDAKLLVISGRREEVPGAIRFSITWKAQNLGGSAVDFYWENKYLCLVYPEKKKRGSEEELVIFPPLEGKGATGVQPQSWSDEMSALYTISPRRFPANESPLVFWGVYRSESKSIHPRMQIRINPDSGQGNKK